MTALAPRPVQPKGLPLASAVLDAPEWRKEPYRAFFVLGAALAWAGVGPWLLYAAGAVRDYKSIFHSMAQVQGFLACFAVGFLFTLIPRKTRTPPPAAWQMATGLAAPVATTALAWFGLFAAAQVAWVVLLVLLMGFAFPRLRRGADLPDSFVWAGVGLAAALLGTVLSGLGGALGGRSWWLHEVGRGLVLQGLFSGLIVGTGGMLLPAIVRGDPFAQGGGLRGKAPHLALGLVFLASFFVEARASFPLGYFLRAGSAGGALAAAARLWRPPALGGLHRRLAWVAAWMLPVGFALVGAFPGQRAVLLHVVFIGSFGLIALAVAAHVVLSHGGWNELLGSSPRTLQATAGLLAAALAARLAVGLVPAWSRAALGAAALFFLGATVAWALLLFPRLRPRARTTRP